MDIATACPCRLCGGYGYLDNFIHGGIEFFERICSNCGARTLPSVNATIPIIAWNKGHITASVSRA